MALKYFCFFQDFIREIDPDIIIGYNICKFDLPYLIEVSGLSPIVLLGTALNRYATGCIVNIVGCP